MLGRAVERRRPQGAAPLVEAARQPPLVLGAGAREHRPPPAGLGEGPHQRQRRLDPAHVLDRRPECPGVGVPGEVQQALRGELGDERLRLARAGRRGARSPRRRRSGGSRRLSGVHLVAGVDQRPQDVAADEAAAAPVTSTRLMARGRRSRRRARRSCGRRSAARASRCRTPDRPSARRARPPARTRAHHVEHLGVVDERLEAVGEAGRDVQRACRWPRSARPPNQLCARRRARAQVDDHVVDRPARAAHQLRLAVRLGLVVQPAQRPGARVEGHVALHDRRVEAAGRQLAAVEGAREEPALVLVPAPGSTTQAPGSGVSSNLTRTAAAPAPARRSGRPTRG